MGQLIPGRHAVRRAIEGAIGLAAPVLDVVLFVGERVSRVAGRNEIEPEPPHRISGGEAPLPLDRPRGGAV